MIASLVSPVQKAIMYVTHSCTERIKTKKNPTKVAYGTSDTHLIKLKSHLKQKCTYILTPFSGISSFSFPFWLLQSVSYFAWIY